MSLPLMMAALMGLKGYQNHKQTERDNAEHDEDRAYKRSVREREQKQWAEQDNLKASMRMAVDPATVEPNMEKAQEQDNRDVGLPGEAAPTQNGFRVKGALMADLGSAQKAADAHNVPDAQMTRMSQALTTAGKPMEAQQMRAGARQETEAQRAHINKLYDEQLNGVDSFDALGQFITKSKGDGQGGALQAKPVLNADGKTVTLHKVNPDGTTVPTPYTFPNDARGLMQAKAMLSKAATIGDKLAHLHQQHTESIAQQQANTAESFRTAQETNMVEQRKLESRKLGILEKQVSMKQAGNAPTIEPFDNKLARDTAHDAVRAENKRRGDAGQPLLTGAEAAKLTDDYVTSQQVQYGNRMLMTAAANELGQADPGSPEYAATYARVLSKGDPKQLGAQLVKMGFKPPASAAKPAPAAPQASMRNAAPQASGPAAQPAAAAPAQLDPAALEAKAQQEIAEMSDPRVNRMQFSPDVAAYVKQKQAQERAAGEADFAKRSSAEFQKLQAQRQQRGY